MEKRTINAGETVWLVTYTRPKRGKQWLVNETIQEFTADKNCQPSQIKNANKFALECLKQELLICAFETEAEAMEEVRRFAESGSLLRK